MLKDDQPQPSGLSSATTTSTSIFERKRSLPPSTPLRANVSVDAEPRSYHLPLLLAILPPIGSLFTGSPDAWSDALMLGIATFYLYNLVKIPWELYQDVHIRLYPLTVQPQDTLSKEQVSAVEKLKWHERYLYLLVLVSPLLGGIILLMLQKMLLTNGNRYLTPGTILLYVLTASVRPLSHLVQRIQSRAAVLHVDATYPADPVNQLLHDLDRLESEIKDLRLAMAHRSDLEEVRDELEHAVESVARAVRSSARKEDQARQITDARVEMQRVQAAQQSLVVRCVWEPVTVLKEAVGVSKPPSAVTAPGRGLLGFGSSKT